MRATLSFSDGSPSVELPIYAGTVGPDVIDIRKLSGNGQYFRTKNAQGSYDKLIWAGNKFFGFAGTGAIIPGATPNQFLPVSGVNPDAIVAAWLGSSGFQGKKYQAARTN